MFIFVVLFVYRMNVIKHIWFNDFLKITLKNKFSSFTRVIRYFFTKCPAVYKNIWLYEIWCK